jgi:hypothetical protein
MLLPPLLPKLKRNYLVLILLLTSLFGAEGKAALWPDAPWLNRLPQANAPVSIVAFVSPYELQFYRTMNIWRRLEKKYGYLQVNFIIVATGEQGLPMTDEVVRSVLKEYDYTLPVLLDQYSSFAKTWHAYVSPTVSLVLRDGHLTNFDAGNLDPATLEKSLQKALKDIPLTALPPREFNNDGEVKNCGHNHTIFVAERFGKAWSPELFSVEGPWVSKPLWIESDGAKKVQLELNSLKSSAGILAEAPQGKTAKFNVLLDGQRVPLNLRGKDIQEDKSGNTFVLIQGLKMYETISHSANLKEPGQKLTLTTESKGLRLRALETLPTCLEAD